MKDGEVIGSGYNSPPRDLESQRRCQCDKKILDSKVTDKTCCIHAEQRAIMDALSKNAEKLPGSRLYFVRIDDEGKMKFSGEPYCTICSKMAIDTGIQEFVLYRKDGLHVYDTEEYNLISFQFQSE